MDTLQLKNKKLSAIGTSYHFLVPKNYVEESGILQNGEEYDLLVLKKGSAEIMRRLLELVKTKQYEQINQFINNNSETLTSSTDLKAKLTKI